MPARLRSAAEAASLRLEVIPASAELAVVTHEPGRPRLQMAYRRAGGLVDQQLRAFAWC